MQTDNSAAARLQRRRRSMTWSLVAIIVLAMALPGAGYVLHWAGTEARAQTQAQTPAQSAPPAAIEPAGPAVEAQPARPAWDPSGPNPRSETWRHARADGQGYVAASGPYTTNQLINNRGQNWRQLREGPLKTYAGWLLVLTPILILVFFLVRGRVRLDDGRSGLTVPRWSLFERTLHWFTAITFIILAITGLSILFGRTVLIPLFGHAGNSAWAEISMNVHNYVGPAFSIGILLMIVCWAAHNVPNRADLEWFKRGGGILGHDHPPSGRLNGGEKVWFWGGVFLLGLTVVISGYVLDFPQFGQSRDTMSAAHLFHAVAACIWIAVAMGHIYIGTLGTEGAFEGMATGRVDANWARQHHDLWYEELVREGITPEPAGEEALPTGAGSVDKDGRPPPRPPHPQVR